VADEQDALGATALPQALAHRAGGPERGRGKAESGKLKNEMRAVRC
jgi:hypothetical protein